MLAKKIVTYCSFEIAYRAFTYIINQVNIVLFHRNKGDDTDKKHKQKMFLHSKLDVDPFMTKVWKKREEERKN